LPFNPLVQLAESKVKGVLVKSICSFLRDECRAAALISQLQYKYLACGKFFLSLNWLVGSSMIIRG